MALNNTNERYNYIYGNNALKQKRSQRYYQGTSPEKLNPNPEKTPERKRAHKHAVKVQENFDRRYTALIMLAVAVLMVGALFYVNETGKLRTKMKEIQVLKEEKANLEAKQSSLYAELEKSINLNEIGKYAEEKLDMVYPNQNNTIYYYVNNNDYFRQYESIDK